MNPNVMLNFEFSFELKPDIKSHHLLHIIIFLTRKKCLALIKVLNVYSLLILSIDNMLLNCPAGIPSSKEQTIYALWSRKKYIKKHT